MSRFTGFLLIIALAIPACNRGENTPPIAATPKSKDQPGQVKPIDPVPGMTQVQKKPPFSDTASGGDSKGQGPGPQGAALDFAQYKVLDFIDIAPEPGKEYEPPEGSKVLWVQINVKKSEQLPKTLNLAQVRLLEEPQAKYPLRGIGFGGSDPAIHHLVGPGSSGTVKTSGDDVGEVIFDAGQQTVTFLKMPPRLSLVFVVPREPTSMTIEGLFGGSLKIK